MFSKGFLRGRYIIYYLFILLRRYSVFYFIEEKLRLEILVNLFMVLSL